ncbi:MAG TPA: LysR family transcriptional regulator [Acidobacteriaceae bacterium]|jgi:DNA-binding transcriptional LysR family regulator|nr:LysR family transcriptional regulator [Acidobacteriaceae bacterium]
MSDLLEFRLLKYIAVIAEVGNFTRAAEKLFTSQPSLSHQIIDLEDGLGMEIFERSRERVTPTPGGLIIVEYAKEAVRTRNEVVRTALAVQHGEVPPLRLGFSCFVPTPVLEGFQRVYEALFPACPAQFAGGDPARIADKLQRKTLDCALLPMPVKTDDLIIVQIASAPLVVCMREDDPLARLSEIRPEEIADRLRVFRAPESHPAAHRRLMEMLGEIGIRPAVSCVASTPSELQWMVQRGFGLALIDQQIRLEPFLTARPIAGVRWSADTAFVHDAGADHLALPLLVRHLGRSSNGRTPPRRISRIKGEGPVQLELLA